MSAPAIDTAGLTKFYGETCGIEDLELRVERGDGLRLSRAGKTTTRLLHDLIRLTRGSAAIADPTRTVRAWRCDG